MYGLGLASLRLFAVRNSVTNRKIEFCIEVGKTHKNLLELGQSVVLPTPFLGYGIVLKASSTTFRKGLPDCICLRIRFFSINH